MPQLVLDDVQMNQVVYIYGCQDSVIIIKGKCNSISVDNCKKTSIVFDDIVSTVEFVNCQSVKAQAMGVIPIFSIDKTDGAHIYLSEASAKAEIVTSKASEVNISVPSGPDGDFVSLYAAIYSKRLDLSGREFSSTSSEVIWREFLCNQWVSFVSG